MEKDPKADRLEPATIMIGPALGFPTGTAFATVGPIYHEPITKLRKLALRRCELELLRSHPKDERGSARKNGSVFGWNSTLLSTIGVIQDII